MVGKVRAREGGLFEELERIVGPRGVVRQTGALAAYESDGFLVKARPAAVCLPRTTAEVAALIRLAAARGMPVTPRGAGTGLSGGATAVGGGLVIGTSRMNRIVRLDAENRCAVVQPGVVNLELSRAAEPYGLYYAPDPSSQGVSTIGGNVAENAGGAHCLKYGVTTNHVLGLEAVLADGRAVRLGSFPGGGETPGYDLPGLVTGSEGNLAFATAIAVRLLPRPESARTLLALFGSALEAGDACSAIIGYGTLASHSHPPDPLPLSPAVRLSRSGGIVPAALEFIDHHVISALRGAGFLDYPADAGAVVLVEVEGLSEQTADEAARVHDVLLERGATEVRDASTAAERARLWAGRKGAAGALGHLAPNYYIQDGVVPRSRMVEVLMKIEEIAQRERLRVVNVFHAGDGNLHPTVVFDAREPGMVERVVAVGAQILRACVDAGGTLSGEHGIGLEKQAYLDWVMTREDQAAQWALKRAFDPARRLNPGKPFSGPRPGAE